MVDTVTAAEHRQQLVNTIYVAFFAVGLGTGISGEIDITRSYVTVPAFIVSIIWWQQLINFRKSVEAKFHVIKQLEQKLSFTPFTDEDTYVKQSRNRIRD